MNSSPKDSISKDIIFYSDGLELRGTLHSPLQKCFAVVIGCHGLLSNKNSPKQIALANQCNRLGIAFFRFDHRGCGESQGEFDQVTSLAARCRDLISAIECIKKSTGCGTLLGLFGSSMGGAVCLNVAAEQRIAAIVTFAAPVHSKMMKRGLKNPEKRNDRADDSIPKNICFDIRENLPRIRNILIFHGEADQVVPVSHAREIFRQAGDPKRLVIQEKGDHPMSHTAHQQEFIREASLWFKAGLIGRNL